MTTGAVDDACGGEWGDQAGNVQALSLRLDGMEGDRGRGKLQDRIGLNDLARDGLGERKRGCLRAVTLEADFIFESRAIGWGAGGVDSRDVAQARGNVRRRSRRAALHCVRFVTIAAVEVVGRV